MGGEAGEEGLSGRFAEVGVVQAMDDEADWC